jgi:hypothetical protein
VRVPGNGELVAEKEIGDHSLYASLWREQH